jgi:hypothetical protein
MLWVRDWEFCRRLDCRDRNPVASLRDRSYARQWLQSSKQDYLKMLGMRTLLSQEDNEHDFFRMTDEAVIDQIAKLLSSGRLHIHMLPIRGAVLEGSEQSQRFTTFVVTDTEKFVAFPLSERSPRVPGTFREPAVDPPTFSSNMDAAAQAATLVAAAAEGKPFCPE